MAFTMFTTKQRTNPTLNSSVVEVTPDIMERMNKLARSKEAGGTRWETSLVGAVGIKREDRIMQLEQDLDKLATSETSESEAISELMKQLERSKVLYNESAGKLQLLSNDIEQYHIDVEFARNRLEETLSALLSG